MNDVTLGIKTFDRPDCLRRMLQSVRRYYPRLAIVVADDGKTSAEDICREYGARRLAMPFDSGLSAGRNRLVDVVQTDLILLADDDFIFTEETDLPTFRRELLTGYDILGGALKRANGSLQRYEGLMEQVGSILRLYRPNPRRTCPVHIVLNWLIARTQVLRQIRWHEPLKMIEHEDFFWRCRIAGVRVGYCPSVLCIHDSQQPHGYPAYRNRTQAFQAMARARWGWQSVVWTVAK